MSSRPAKQTGIFGSIIFGLIFSVVGYFVAFHFGKPIVPTPSNFGLQGTPPTHPDLLDWLAGRLIDSGWSIKAMHRLIMSSETYQLAAAHDANNVAIDSGNDTVDDLGDSPDSASTTIPAISLSLTYTFDNLDTEVFLGDSVEDFVRLDFATVAGVRHNVEGAGIFEIVAVQTPFATDVWADPYLLGEERDETEREVNGFRLQWGRMLQSGLDLRISRREASIDDESSGATLLAASLITPAEQRLLDRNGDVNSTRLTYNWA